MKSGFSLALCLLLVGSAQAVITVDTQRDESAFAFDAQLSNNDLIAGAIATELAVPTGIGWHSANTNPADQLPAFTDGAGVLGSNLTGLLNDNPSPGNPTKRVQYDLSSSVDIGEIRVLSGNNLGADGRVFNTFTVEYSTNNGGDFNLLGYFQSDLYGSGNPSGGIARKSTLMTVSDDASPVLIAGATNLIFNLYSVSNTAGRFDDPFDGANHFTGLDDGFAAAFESPLIWEIDVIKAVPEPSTFALAGFALAGFALLRRRVR